MKPVDVAETEKIDATAAEKLALEEIRKAKGNELILKYRKNEKEYSSNDNLSKEFSRLIGPKKIPMDELLAFEKGMEAEDKKNKLKSQQVVEVFPIDISKPEKEKAKPLTKLQKVNKRIE